MTRDGESDGRELFVPNKDVPARGTASSTDSHSVAWSTALPEPVLAAMRAALPEVSGQTVITIADEVPGYRGEFDPDSQANLARAVELALRAFLALAAEDKDPSAPLAPALEGAYALGRGEARSGRSMDSLLGAYRVGARVAWRGLAHVAAEAGLSAGALVGFAELVFAYIDQLSAASVAGHAQELALEGRLRERHLERLGHGLVTGAEEATLVAEALRAGWTPPETLTAVILPEDRVDEVLARIDPRSLQPHRGHPRAGAPVPRSCWCPTPDPGSRTGCGAAWAAAARSWGRRDRGSRRRPPSHGRCARGRRCPCPGSCAPRTCCPS